MSERCEQTSERTSERPSTLGVDFIVLLPNVDPVDPYDLFELAVKTGLEAGVVTRDESLLGVSPAFNPPKSAPILSSHTHSVIDEAIFGCTRY